MLEVTKLHLTSWSDSLKDKKLKVGDQESAAFYLGEVGTLTVALHGEEMLLHDFRVSW